MRLLGYVAVMAAGKETNRVECDQGGAVLCGKVICARLRAIARIRHTQLVGTTPAEAVAVIRRHRAIGECVTRLYHCAIILLAEITGVRLALPEEMRYRWPAARLPLRTGRVAFGR